MLCVCQTLIKKLLTYLLTPRLRSCSFDWCLAAKESEIGAAVAWERLCLFKRTMPYHCCECGRHLGASLLWPSRRSLWMDWTFVAMECTAFIIRISVRFSLASEMTYIVSSGALNSTHSLTHVSAGISFLTGRSMITVTDSRSRYPAFPRNSSSRDKSVTHAVI